MEGPSRTKMLQHRSKKNALPQTSGDAKVQVMFNSGRTSVLAIRCSDVTLEFLEQFCAEHGLTLTEKDNYYHLSEKNEAVVPNFIELQYGKIYNR